MTTKIIFKNTVLFFAVTLFTALNFVCNAQNKSKVESQKSNGYETEIQTGAQQTAQYLPLLKDRKVGVLTNQTGIIELWESGKVISRSQNGCGDETETAMEKVTYSIIDFLIEKNINVQKIFAPEHGFRGTADAGEIVKDGKDTKTGLPIVSLYGNNKKPTQEQLQGLDMVVFDIQDVGVRFYTYISTLHYVMEACAEAAIPVLILDRPNPNIHYIDGPVLEPEFKSFVGMHPIPVVHGMTIAEYAQMINGEGWLENGMKCELKIVPVKDYTRAIFYSLPINPSPILPNDMAINLYPSTCFFEGTTLSEGRGTDKQFQVFGSPTLP